jgi:phage gpG-like protein
VTFAELAKKFRDVRDALAKGELPTFRRVFSDGVLRDVQDAFTNAADPVTGAPWAPLKYRKGQILVVSGMLRHRTMEAANSPCTCRGRR